MKVVTLVGARPNFIKMAALSAKLRKHFTEIVVHSGQHYDYEMDQVFFDELGILEPDHHLGIGSNTHGRQTGEMLARIEDVLVAEQPELVLVFGDVNTTLAGALAASKLCISVAHVEAGLRSFDRRMPEEVNRVLTDHCSDLLFCPTVTSVANLAVEGITDGVHLTGDVTVDTLRDHACAAATKSSILQDLNLCSKEYHLATVHRPQITDNIAVLKLIVDAFCEIGSVVFPCHPRTEICLKQYGLWKELVSTIDVVRPVGYYDMLVLENNARRILTDSGGVQKEAYFFKVPCVTLRERTEWIETVEDGWNVLVGTNKSAIIRMANEFEPATKQTEVLGQGNASRNVCRILVGFSAGAEDKRMRLMQ